LIFVLGAEIQHFLGFANAAGPRAGDGAALHQQRENGKRRGTVWRTQEHKNGVAFEQVDVGVDIVIRGNRVQDHVETARVSLDGLRVVGHHYFIGTEAQRIFFLFGRSGELHHVRTHGMRKFQTHMT
jgi:hypothetical protein